MHRLMKHIPSQKKTGPLIGGLKELFGRTSFYITVINFMLLIVTAYYTTIRDFVNMPFIWFFVIIMLILGFAMLIEYVYILPSSMIFQNSQSYKHENPFKNDIQLILNRLDEIEQKIDRK